MSKREEMRQRRLKQTRQRQLLIIGGIVVVALAVAGWLAYQNFKPIGEFVPVATETWPTPDGKALGPAGAKVLIQEFADFQCPICGSYAATVEPLLIKDYLSTGQVRYEYHHFIIIDGNVGGHESQSAAEASECANEQGQFWNYHKMLFANQQGEGRGAFTDRRLKAFAGALGLDQQKFDACFDSHRYKAAVLADSALAQQIGATGTPTLVINGVKVDSPLDYAAIKQQLDTILGQ